MAKKEEIKETKNSKTTKSVTKKTVNNVKEVVKEKKTPAKKVVKEKSVLEKKSSPKKVEEKKAVKVVKKKTIEPEKIVKEEKKTNNILKFFKENKKLLNIILVVAIVAVIVVAFIVSINETNEKTKYFNTISYANFDSMYNTNDDKIHVVYWASPTCGYCTQFKPTVIEVSHEYGITFNYLNTSLLTDDNYATLYSYFSKYDETYNSNSLGTPSIILIKNGEIIDISVGVLEKDVLVNYLIEKNVISK